MKFKLLAGFLLIALVAFGVGNSYAIDETKYWRAWPGNNLFTGDVAFYDGATFEIAGAQIYTEQDATITSPAVTFDVTDLFYISLTSDQNVTGIYPTGGVLNQVIVITPGAGSNTMRFDSGTTTTLHGENITLTEGTTDTLTLICIDATTPRWKILDPIASMVNAVANNSTAETVYPTFLDGATGAQQIETDTGFTYNPNTGVVTATSFSGSVTIGRQLYNTTSTFEITSPSRVLNLSGLNSHVTLTSDENITGASISGGSAGCIYIIKTGAGSNTVRFDDNGTTLGLGGNITVTEGEDDIIGIIVTGTNTYARIFSADN